MTPDYYHQCNGPAKESNNPVEIDCILIGLFYTVLLIPVVLHFHHTIFSHVQIILLTFVRRFKSGLHLLCQVYDIFWELQHFQPSQQNHKVNLHNKKKRTDQASPPSEDYLQVAVQQIQLTLPSNIEELVHPVQPSELNNTHHYIYQQSNQHP